MKTKVSAAAKEEMAREKARILRREKRGLSLLEQAAIALNKKREQQRRKMEQEKRTQREKQKSAISIQQMSSPSKTSDTKAADTTLEWSQYNPWQEERSRREPKLLNEASIWTLAKRIIAKEWARALGRKTEDLWILALEREAAEYRKKKEEEKKRAEEESKRIEQEKELLEESLQTFSKELLETKERAQPNQAAELFEKALENVGEVIEVNWRENGCEAHIEPWEEKKLRRKRQVSEPVIYKAKINEMLKVVSYERINRRGDGNGKWH